VHLAGGGIAVGQIAERGEAAVIYP